MVEGQTAVDLVFELPPGIVEATEQLASLFDELDDFCRHGDLLTLVTPADLAAYRRWVFGEVANQVRDGRAPRPWADVAPAPEPPAPAPPAEPPRAAATVRVEDDLDLASASEVRQILLDRIEQGATDIVIDLSDCTFLDSTGLSLLVTTHHRLLELGGGLRIAGAKDQVQGLLDLSGTTDFFGKG
jgi:anti-sigma B factor antagonist